MSAIRYDRDNLDIVTLTMDLPGQSANTMNADFRAAWAAVVDRLHADQAGLRGVILASAKRTFFAGGDLRELVQVQAEDAARFQKMLVEQITAPMRRLETLGVPVVAAINGSALGGGWELCLACHGRIAVSRPEIEIGLPEVTLGLLPGGGGTVRLPRLIGLEQSLPLLLEGTRLRPEGALKAGLLDAVVDEDAALLPACRDWIMTGSRSRQPWDEKGYRLPNGGPDKPNIAQMLAIAPAMLKKKTRGCYPAPEAILASVVEGARVDFDTALKIEARYFTSLVIGPVSKNMIGTFWFQLNAIRAGHSRPDGFERHRINRVGVLGAGMMGSGIAWATASRGIDTVLKDLTLAAAERGRDYSRTLAKKRVSRGRMSSLQADELLDRIQATAQAETLTGCDLIIEAVYEDSDLKARVTREAEPLLSPGGVFASNTSTIPITQLATASGQPDRFIGLHFFSPVDKMQLVEIIRGAATSDETLARAFDFVLQIGKIPIVVNDSRGFFTSRVFGTFVNEGMAMLGEGISAALIENAALLAGMPVGPLAVSDEVSLTLMAHIRDQSRKDSEAQGQSWQAHPAEAVVDRMIQEFDRRGKAGGGGFYDYPAGATKHLWAELDAKFAGPSSSAARDLVVLKDRLLFVQALETLRCLDENVLRSVADANIGSVFGIGFPPWTGGAIQFVNQYGLAAFRNRAQQLAEICGERFAPPRILIDHAERGSLIT